MPMDTKGERYKVWLYINEMDDFQSGLAGREKGKQNKTQNEGKGTSLPQYLATHKWISNQTYWSRSQSAPKVTKVRPPSVSV